MYASEESSVLSKVLEISTWILLFIALVPGTALGYFAENSLPSSALYPLKKSIEIVVLKLVSVNNSAKTIYQLNLASTRVKEIQAVFASNNAITTTDIGQLDVAFNQFTDTQSSIQTIQDPIQKTQLKAQLQTTITEYQQQLSQIHDQLVNSTQLQPNNSNSQNQTPAQSSIVPSQALLSPQVTQSTPPIESNISDLTPQQKSDLEEKIKEDSEKASLLQKDLNDDGTSNNKNGEKHSKDQGDKKDKQRDNKSD